MQATYPESIVRPKMPELDSLRGAAILLVVFYHGLFWSNNLTGLTGAARVIVELTKYGWLGVNLFFVISGFLITGILADSRSAENYYRRFYYRRALRILPAFYAVLLVLAFIPGQNRSYIALSCFYLSNLAPLFAVPMTYTMLWSLAVEEHFYLIWPFFVRNLPNTSLMFFAGAIAIVVPVFRALAFTAGPSEGFGYYTWLVADGLATGALLALYVRGRQFSRRGLARLSAAALAMTAALALFGAPLGVLTRTKVLGATLLLTAVNLYFVAILGFCLLLGTSRWRFVVNWPVLQFFGKISYGLYLIHWLVFSSWDSLTKDSWLSLSRVPGHATILFLRFAAAGGIATGIAYLSRQYFEERFLRLKGPATSPPGSGQKIPAPVGI